MFSFSVGDMAQHTTAAAEAAAVKKEKFPSLRGRRVGEKAGKKKHDDEKGENINIITRIAKEKRGSRK